MTYNVVSTAEFDAALNEALAYRIDTRGKRSARRLLEDVEGQSNLLSTTPRMGALVNQSEENPAPDSLRWIRMDSYMAVYRVHDEKCLVALEKLFYATTNWRRRVCG